MFSAFQRVPRLLILALTGALLLTLALPLAAFAQSSQTETLRATGDEARATFHSVDSTGCIVTDVAVGIGQGQVVVNNGNTSFQDIVVGESQFDQCAQNLLSSSFGNALTITSFQLSGLSSATVQATVQMLDVVNSVTFNFAVNLTWQGFGAVQNTQSNGTVHTPGFVEIESFSGQMRNATATGSVTANGINYTPDPSTSLTEIDHSTNGIITVQTP